MPLFWYSWHQVAFGRSGLWQADLQSHLHVSQRKTFIPSIFLMRILALSSQLGPDFFLLEDISNAPNSYWASDDTNTPQTCFDLNICLLAMTGKSLSYSTGTCQRRMAACGRTWGFRLNR